MHIRTRAMGIHVDDVLTSHSMLNKLSLPEISEERASATAGERGPSRTIQWVVRELDEVWYPTLSG